MDVYHAFKLAPWTLLKLWQLSFMLSDYLLYFGFIYFMCMCVYLSVCLCTTCVQMPKEARRGH